jgi:predicted nucleic acid-binding protein
MGEAGVADDRGARRCRVDPGGSRRRSSVNARAVCDASALVALLLDSGPDGQWVTRALSGATLAAPGLVAFETANIIRRHELAGAVSTDQAAQAHGDLLALAIEHWPYELLAPRAWELRRNLSSYDAGYVALAELIDATLVTLDRRIGRAPGLGCKVTTP